MALQTYAYATPSAGKCTSMPFLAGAGIYDITGPTAGLGMMGYGQIKEKTHGLLQRIYARAFIFAESDNPNQRVAFVVADLGQIFQSVHQEVIKRLKTLYGGLYTEKNIMLNATHSHSGPGAYSHDSLYNLTTFGFDEQNFEVIVDGIVQAIKRAHDNLSPSKITLSKGDVEHASFNRSAAAYELNPDEEKNKYNDNVERVMLQLRMDNDAGPFAVLNWFGVHGTSLNNKNLLISGDNKGCAALLFERMHQSRYDEHAFVAGFAQTISGDVSPNEHGAGLDGMEGIEKMLENATKQTNTALSLFNDSNSRELFSGIDFRQTYVNMAEVSVRPEYTAGDGLQHTCPSAIGISMLAGAADGPGYGRQGIRCHELGETIEDTYEEVDLVCNPFFNSCHHEKPIVLSTGTTWPPMIPQILPLQIMRIGSLALVGLPFEITTMAGRRIKELVADKLAPIGVTDVVVVALSNGYAGYVTTKEEYHLQRYEAASNQFGPYALNAILQIVGDLSVLMVTNQEGEPGPQPLDLSAQQVHRAKPLIIDRIPFWEKWQGHDFGAIKEDVDEHYSENDRVSVEFWGAYPSNNLLINDSFLFVEKLIGETWEPVFFDRDIETIMEWKRFGLDSSIITIRWQIPAGTEGRFRIRHQGYSRDITEELTPYEGISSEFTVAR